MNRKVNGYVSKSVNIKYVLYPLYRPCKQYAKAPEVKNEKFNKNLSNFLKNYKLFLKKSSKIFNERSINVCDFVLKSFRFFLPIKIFGTKRNFRLFERFVKKIVNCASYECIFIHFLTKGFNYNSIDWISDLDEISHKINLLQQFLLFLGEKVKIFILKFFYVTSCITNATYQRFLIPYHKWNSFYDKIIDRLEKENYIKKHRPGSRRISHGYLRILPKSKDLTKYRLIIRSVNGFNKCKNWKLYQKRIQNLTKTNFNGKVNCDQLFQNWRIFVENVKPTYKQVYGIFIDLKDAFFNLNISELKRILQKCVLEEDYLSKEEKDDFWKLINHYLEDSGPVIYIGKNHKSKLYENMFQAQKGSYDYHRYRWIRGLLQGDMLSSSLYNFGRSYFEDIYLSELYSTNTFIHRTVDDYFLCTTNLETATRFYNIMTTKCQVNYDKIQSNCSNFTTIPTNKISYCGRIFHLNSFEVSGEFHENLKSNFKDRFKLWDFSDKSCSIYEFLRRAARFDLNNFHFNLLEINLIFNSFERLIENCFESMVYVTNKILCALKSIGSNLNKVFLYNYLLGIAKYYANRLKFIVNIYSNKIIVEESIYLVITLQSIIMTMKKWNKFPKTVLDLLKQKEKHIRYPMHYRILMNKVRKKVQNKFRNLIL